jgi:hypothetical protein
LRTFFLSDCVLQVLTQIVDCVEGTMLQQAWVADAFAALQVRVGWDASRLCNLDSLGG